MRKVINGRIYDTTTAVKVGSTYGGSEYVTDFTYWQETLYRTPRSRQYFLLGEGGPMTRYARRVGPNEWIGGERIIPLSEEEALRWAERHLDAETVEAEWPHRVEDA